MDAIDRERLTGDNPKTEISEDEFGLKKITLLITEVLLKRIDADGYAIGLEGDWGAGKSSLLSFITGRLSEYPSRHKVIHFQPWQVGKKDALLSALFALLINEIRRFSDIPQFSSKINATNPKLIERIAVNLARYSSAINGASSVLDAAISVDPTLISTTASIVLKISLWLAKLGAPKRRSLEELKSEICDDLRVLQKLADGFRFTIVIDDLDRLEPAESVEILRLIRAVANFPAVTYVVSFDRGILAKHVQKIIGVGDGHDYIEKIFQNFVSLPPQEPFALRRYARKLLSLTFPDEMQANRSARASEMVEREQVLFDTWIGKFVKTPRDAVRLCEAVKLGWPFIKQKADFIDYVWLQLVKLKCHDLYLWTRAYVVNIGSYRDGGRPGDDEPEAEAIKLRKILTSLSWQFERDAAGISYFLPGVTNYVDQSGPRVFELKDHELEQFENDRRLGSPSHWRLYFSFDIPSYALDDEILVQFLREVTNDQQAAADIIRALLVRPHEQPSYYFQTLLERLFDKRDKLSDLEKIGIGKTLAEVMDEVPESRESQLDLYGPWRRALSLMTAPVSPHFRWIVKNSKSVNWLAQVLRDQGYAHGIPDKSRARTERQWLEIGDFESARTEILARFKSMGLDEIVKKPQPADILFCWLQLGDADQLRRTVLDFISDDARFIDFLYCLRSWSHSSDRGFSRPLRPDVVSNFVDAAASWHRLVALTNHSDENIRAKATELREAWVNSERD